MEFVEVNEVQASIVLELTEVVGSVESVDSSVTSLHTCVKKDVVGVLDCAWVQVQDEVAESESSA